MLLYRLHTNTHTREEVWEEGEEEEEGVTCRCLFLILVSRVLLPPHHAWNPTAWVTCDSHHPAHLPVSHDLSCLPLTATTPLGGRRSPLEERRIFYLSFWVGFSRLLQIWAGEGRPEVCLPTVHSYDLCLPLLYASHWRREALSCLPTSLPFWSCLPLPLTLGNTGSGGRRPIPLPLAYRAWRVGSCLSCIQEPVPAGCWEVPVPACRSYRTCMTLTAIDSPGAI